jgi:hypothetical protein
MLVTYYKSLVKINEDFKVLDYIQRNGNTSFVAMKKQLDPTFVGEEEDDKVQLQA